MISSRSPAPSVRSRKRIAPVAGSSASTVSTASRTLARIGATWSVSHLGLAASGPAPSGPAARNASSETRSSGSGASERNGSSGPGAARDRAAALDEPRVQHLRRVLERLAVEQPREQQVALLEPRQLLVEVDVVAAGQQAPRLQLDERRGDEQELGGRLEVEALHALDLRAERVDDARERDLPEVDLFLQDEMEEEVERALEDRRRDLVGHGRRVSNRLPRSTHLRAAPGNAPGKRPRHR